MPSYLPVDVLAYRRACRWALVVTLFWLNMTAGAVLDLVIRLSNRSQQAEFLSGALYLQYGTILIILVGWWMIYLWRKARRLKPYIFDVSATDNEMRGVPELDQHAPRHMNFRDDSELPPSRW